MRQDVPATSSKKTQRHPAPAKPALIGAPRLGRSLGLRVESREQFMVAIRKGLTFRAFDHLAQALAVSDSELAKIVSISGRTLSRRREEGHFQAEESDRLARIAMLFDEAVTLFEGDEATAATWLTTPKKALADATPLQYADTEPGAQEVRDLIGRLEYGIFS